ncbi:hypothetical protein A3L12_04750 [Thermococcus sp. P6]|nr:hypothetical protein A3L12_04750 [Thermococcus sp. P6]
MQTVNRAVFEILSGVAFLLGFNRSPARFTMNPVLKPVLLSVSFLIISLLRQPILYILLFNKAYKPPELIIPAFLCIRCFLWKDYHMFENYPIKLDNRL